MAEDIDVGTLSIGVKITDKDVENALNNLKQRMKEIVEFGTAAKGYMKDLAVEYQNVAKNGNNSFSNIEKSVDNIGKKAKVVSQELSNVGNNSGGIDKYSVKIETLNAKIEAQQDKVGKLGAELDDITEQYFKLEQIAGRSSDIDISKIAPDLSNNFDKEIIKLDELKNQLLLTEQAREQAAQKAEMSAQRQADSAEKAAQRQIVAGEKLETQQNKANNTLALSTAAMALQTVARNSDGAANGLMQVATQVIFLKQALNTVATPAARMGTAIAGGIGIAVTAIALVSEHIKKVKEEQIKAAQEASNAFMTSQEEISLIEKSIKVLNDQKSTTEQLTTAKQELARLSPQMIAGYNAEGEAILKTNEVLKAELEYRQKLAKAQQVEASRSLNVNFVPYAELAQKYNETNSKIAKYKEELQRLLQEPIADYSQINFYEETIKALEIKSNSMYEPLTENIKALIPSIRARISEMTGSTEISDALSDLFFSNKLEKGGIKDPEKFAQSVIDQYNQINSVIDEDLKKQIENSDPMFGNILNQKFQQCIEEMNSNPDFDLTEWAEKLKADMQSALSGDLLGDVEIFKNLGEKILGGEATQKDMAKYNEFLNKIRESAKKLDVGFSSLTNSANKTSNELLDQAAKSNSLKKTYSDLGKGVSDLFNNYKSLNKETSDLGALKAVSSALHQGKTAKDYGNALKYVAEMYGVTEEQAKGMVGTIDREISAKEALMVANAMAGQAEANFQILTIQAMARAGQITITEAAKMVEALRSVASMYASMFGGDGTINIDTSKIKVPRPSGGGKSSGGGSKQNTALDNELKRLEHKKAMDNLTYSEELAWLERIRSKYAKTAEEKQELDEKVYSAKKALLEAEREHAKNMDQLTLQEEIKSLESQMRLYRSGTQARMELEEQVYQAKKDLERQVYDLNVYYGKLNLEEQAKQIEKMISKYKEGTQARIDLEKELYDIQKQIKERDAQSIDKVAEGITEALRNRYEQQRDAEQQRIEDSKKSWQEWSDAQVKAIQDQMDALDDLTKQEDQAEEERKRRRKIAALEMAISYETDDYTRNKLQQQLENERADLDKWLTKLDRDKQKELLKEEQERIKEQAEKEQELLDDEWEAKNKEYEEFLKEFNLKAEAEKMLIKGNQEEILELIKSYAPEYDIVGQTIGEKLVDGFMSQAKNIEAWFNSFSDNIAKYQEQMAILATQAADTFYKNQAAAEQRRADASSQPPTYILNVTVNKEVSTASELRNELERMIRDISSM